MKRQGWRKTDRLWKEFGHVGEAPAPAPRDPVEVARAVLARAKADPFTSPRTLRQLEADVQRALMKRAKWKNPKREVMIQALDASRAYGRRREWAWVPVSGHEGAFAHLDGRLLLFPSEKLARKAGAGRMDRLIVERVGKAFGLRGPSSWYYEAKLNPRRIGRVVAVASMPRGRR